MMWPQRAGAAAGFSIHRLGGVICDTHFLTVARYRFGKYHKSTCGEMRTPVHYPGLNANCQAWGSRGGPLTLVHRRLSMGRVIIG